MANTSKIKTAIEPTVRDWLKREIGDNTLEERPVYLPSGGTLHVRCCVPGPTDRWRYPMQSS